MYILLCPYSARQNFITTHAPTYVHICVCASVVLVSKSILVIVIVNRLMTENRISVLVLVCSQFLDFSYNYSFHFKMQIF